MNASEASRSIDGDGGRFLAAAATASECAEWSDGRLTDARSLIGGAGSGGCVCFSTVLACLGGGELALGESASAGGALLVRFDFLGLGARGGGGGALSGSSKYFEARLLDLPFFFALP